MNDRVLEGVDASRRAAWHKYYAQRQTILTADAELHCAYLAIRDDPTNPALPQVVRALRVLREATGEWTAQESEWWESIFWAARDR
jgi:hypothetical protein